MRLIAYIFFVIGLIFSCNTVRSPIRKISSNQIYIDTIPCGSYEVKIDKHIIGYIVKPIIIKVNKVKEIKEFEQKLKNKYKSKFDKYYRIYFFTQDRAKDTILMTLFLPAKQINNIPNWKCELQEVDNYPKKQIWIDYNCSKNRFKSY